MIDLSIIIINWNTQALLVACLESIFANAGALHLEVIVVDNASTDGSPARIQSDFPKVRLLAQTENKGFTRGNNIGLQAATGRHLLLLNSDTEIIGDALTQMVAYLDANPTAGIVGPHTLNTDRTTQSTKRRFPTLWTGIFESTWLQPLAPRPLLSRFYAEDIPNTATAEVDWVQGSCLLMRGSVYAQIGGMDEGYIMYSEETDLCKRAVNAGWKVVYLGSAQIIHHGGKSTEQASTRAMLYFHKSKIRYFHKHHGWGQAGVVRSVLILSFAQQTVMEALKGAIGHKRALRQQRVSAYRQVIRGLLTP